MQAIVDFQVKLVIKSFALLLCKPQLIISLFFYNSAHQARSQFTMASAASFPDLSKRILKSSNRSRCFFSAKTDSHSQPSFRGQHYKLWDEESMAAAIRLVEKEGKSFRATAEMCRIPLATLHDHVTGKVDPFSKPGPKPYLSPSEEDELVAFLLKCARMGYPKSCKQVTAIVQSIVNSRNMNVEVSTGWWARFKKRHPNLSLRTAAPLCIPRLQAKNPDVLNSYFNELEKTLREHDIFDEPSSIFNCDECGIPLNPKPLKTIHERGSKHVSAVTGNGKSQITILACASASGYALPPFVVFDRKTLNQELTKGEVPGTVYGLSASGWMDTELFQEWFLQHFLKFAPSMRPLILLMDGHSSHFSPEMIKVAKKDGVILFTLPPNTTHLCQPLDKGPFAPLKLEWRKSVQKFLSANPGRAVSRYDFSQLFHETWLRAMNARNITAGFRHTGIFPFNKEAVLGQLRGGERHSDSHQKDQEKGRERHSDSLQKDQERSRERHSDSPQQDHERGAERHSDSPEQDQKINSSERKVKFMRSDDKESDLSDLDTSACYLPPKNNIGRSYLMSKAVSTPKVNFTKKKPQQSSRILTSRDNLFLMEEKERKKREKSEQKALKKRIQEEKKRTKQMKEHPLSQPPRISSMVFKGCRLFIYIFCW